MADISLQNYDWKFEPTRFSSWSRLVSIQAWVHCFINNLYGKIWKIWQAIKTEIMETEKKIISDMQKRAFTDKDKTLRSKKQLNKESRILAFIPFIDEDNIMRANTRLKYAEYLPYDLRFSIILRGMWVTKLIVRSYHIKDGHAAETKFTLANLSQRFWLMQGTRERGDTARIRRVQYIQNMQSQSNRTDHGSTSSNTISITITTFLKMCSRFWWTFSYKTR